MKKSFKSGFTLAEVLITLAVIGVVAAMSIPALIGSTNQQEYKVALKKAVAVLNQAITMSVALDGIDAATCTGCDQDTANDGDIALGTYFKSKLNVIATGPTGADNSFYTADGMLFTFIKNAASACGGSTESTDPLGAGTLANCVVLVDVNGAKGPNQGLSSGVKGAETFKDQYYIVIRDRTALPAGNATDTVAQDAMSY